MPYSFQKEKSDKFLEQNDNVFFKIYKDFEKENIFPANNKFGNTQNLLNYTSDGEASDWMLGEKGILAFSPELGNNDFHSESFYPNVSSAVDICRENFASAIFGIQKSAYSFKFNEIRSFNDKEEKIYLKNFNKDDYSFWAYCKDLAENSLINNLIENDYKMVAVNGILDKKCSNSSETKGYSKFYSISSTIYNEGLKNFDNEARIKISLNSYGMKIKRIIANMIKFDYSASTITRLTDIFDSDNLVDDFFFTDSNFLYDSNKTLTFEKNFTINKLESNNTILFDLKMFTNDNSKYDYILMFDLKIEFNYAIDNKIIRNRVINEINNQDFQYFNHDKNLIGEKLLGKYSIDNYVILNDYVVKSTLDKRNFLILVIGLPILFLFAVSILLIIITIKKINKKKLNKEQKNDFEMKNGALKNIVEEKKCQIFKNISNKSKSLPVFNVRGELINKKDNDCAIQTNNLGTISYNTNVTNERLVTTS